MRLLIQRQVRRREKVKRYRTSTPQPGEVVADGRVDREKLIKLLVLSAEQEALDLCLQAPWTPTALLRGKPFLT